MFEGKDHLYINSAVAVMEELVFRLIVYEMLGPLRLKNVMEKALSHAVEGHGGSGEEF
jgi:hypothetical protein